MAAASCIDSDIRRPSPWPPFRLWNKAAHADHDFTALLLRIAEALKRLAPALSSATDFFVGKLLFGGPAIMTRRRISPNFTDPSSGREWVF